MRVFGREWFNKYQKILLFFVNTSIGRKFFDIDSSAGRIAYFEPNAIHWVVNKEKRVMRAIFSANDKYSLKLYYKLYPIWSFFHFWDLTFANRFLPQWNLGFDTLQIQPTNETDGFDVFITDGADANTNFNDATYDNFLRLGYRTVWGRNSRTMIKMDVSSLSGATISAADLSIYISSTDESETGNNSYGAYRITASWVESSVTWNTQPTIASVENSTVINATDTGYKAFSIPTMVQDWCDGTYTNYGTMIKNPTTGQKPHFNGYLSANATNTPKLDITYTVSDIKEFIGVAQANIKKVLGITNANAGKVAGVAN